MALVNDTADDMWHGKSQDRYDDAYELWLGLKRALEVWSPRTYQICLDYFGVGGPCPERCEDIDFFYLPKYHRLPRLYEDWLTCRMAHTCRPDN